ncbi:unnamed protein product [Anisakis simplex]|uniref:Uncharacterized protein n=1 Tax=Anisakis simplex TaxID=6269 RepID=A0A0M3JVK6_ANISI|nr:unnamed protein product [Anisakis simplex]
MLSQMHCLYSLLICGILFAGDTNADLKNNTGQGHYWPPGWGGFGGAPGGFPGGASPPQFQSGVYPPPGPPVYPPVPPLYPPGPPPIYPPPIPPLPFFFDRYYCSVQASFSLIDHRAIPPPPPPPIGQSFDGPPVGFGPPLPPPPPFGDLDISRQTCRYTATYSQATCILCCKTAARHVGTSQDEVTGILFVFDPVNPLVVAPGEDAGSSLRDKRSPQFDYQRKLSDYFATPPTEEDNADGNNEEPIEVVPISDNRIVQCVCCAPRKRWGLY